MFQAPVLSDTSLHDPIAELRPLVAGLERGPAVDLGFGEGETLELLGELGYGPLYGYEIDPDLVDRAQARLDGVGAPARLFTADATSMSELDDASVQLVVVINALQYFDLPALAATVGRVLRSGGHLVGVVPKPRYYVHPRHLLQVRLRRRPWWLISYPRSALRSVIFDATGRLPRLGAAVPEIGWTLRTLRRFAELGGLEIVEERSTPGDKRALILRRA